ncbi:MAG TPA: T9SS type A sorting domain-containing protein [Ignavibacteriales bacterium]|nr:T9SS type A sorting domain-containing protein [Ignavibacteriales bacterium]HOL80409.1 T9SS type A sorting domain-containing protein [Ignavibacteriales bacterium]HOM64860.1 T9SS type A sorting domain-containing protein [Ignavibacteriales bacterium]HPD67407.1 T9SS type A sorting domain-containing protein [Ignavibacteriales bacterium]HPP32598.1 T9SS type A sorting domain-containing protein [Ignavibacteriales bacterium]
MNGNNSNTWTSFTTSKPSGGTTTTKTARISYTKSGILITKRVLVSDTSKILYFNFRIFCGNKYSSKFDVMVSENSNQTDISKYQIVKTYLRDNARGSYINDNTPVNWESDAIDLSIYKDKEVFIAFRVDNTYDDGGGPNLAGDTWDIDDINLSSTVSNEIINNKNYDIVKIYPNPFNPSTNVEFSLSKKSNVTLKIYDIRGRLLENLQIGNLLPGLYNYQVNLSNYTAGVYVFNLHIGENSKKIKAILLK